jgi:hypothetical protein
MNKNMPAWALRPVTREDHDHAIAANRQGAMHITWPDLNTLRSWAKQHGWPTPLFGFQDAFIAKMLASKDNLELAIEKSGIALEVTRQSYTISGERIRALDALYESRSPTGQPDQWGILVEALREIRRAVEAGVVIHVDGEQPILNWQGFYAWAHGRYHMLEDGYDKWIGDDA